MEAKKQRKQGFFKKNLYYFIIAFVLLAAVSVTVALLVTSNPVIGTVDKNDTGGKKDSTDSGSGSSGKSDNPDNPDNPDKPDDPVKPQEIKFIMPVENGQVIQEYTAASVAYNKTLNIFTGHLALDITAEEGKSGNVLCVYDGEVESVTTAYLTGTTVRIKHENGLVTVYNSIEAGDNIVVGKKIKQGDVIGKISDNNKQEYKDGAHLHFEVYENGEKIDPYKYLDSGEK